jgi:hypothetical protein
MEPPDPNAAAREAIRHWSTLVQLVEFAEKRHGFGDSNGGFGVTYPADLDDFDRAQGVNIPEGRIQVYGFWGPPDGYEVLVSEQTYMNVLAEELLIAGFPSEAEHVRALSIKRLA